ncbi:MAG: trigger factor [Pseudomonadota bacterium]|nr:trigger factor [Pseudomonadota bacterium]
MQVSIETLTGLERRMRVQVPAGRIEEKVRDRLLSVGRTAKIKGFRPGKIPNRVIRQRYGGQVRQEVLQELLQTSYSEAIAQQNLQPAGGPKIEPESLDQGQDLAYTAIFEVYPEFEIKGLDKLEVETPNAEITDSDINSMIENLRKQRGTWESVKRPAADGDRVMINFEGKLKGEIFEGGSGENVAVVLGSDNMFADFEKNLLGISAGESKEFKLKFPKDYYQKNLAGQKVAFSIEAKEVTEQKLPEIDEQFINSMGITTGSEKDFRRDVSENMERQIEVKRRAELKRQVMESLLATNPVELPIVLVEQETRSLQQDAMRQFGIKELKDAPPADTFREASERRVRLGLLMTAILRDNKLEVEKGLVESKIRELCEPYDKPEEMRKIYYQDPQLLSQVKNMVLEERVVEWLLSKATRRDKSVTFMELMDL